MEDVKWFLKSKTIIFALMAFIGASTMFVRSTAPVVVPEHAERIESIADAVEQERAGATDAIIAILTAGATLVAAWGRVVAKGKIQLAPLLLIFILFMGCDTAVQQANASDFELLGHIQSEYANRCFAGTLPDPCVRLMRGADSFTLLGFPEQADFWMEEYIKCSAGLLNDPCQSIKDQSIEMLSMASGMRP